MSKTVIRYDRGGSLRSPVTTPQGFLRVDGYAARVGIYQYRNADGTVRRELRPPEEVFHPDSLASYDAASITNDHPAEEVTADNVRKYEVGAVAGPGRRDGDRVVTSAIVKDAKTIAAARAGRRQLSPGYRIRLDETPGEDSRYATTDNPRGRWDVIQRDIRVNHLALVDRARGGQAMALRMDSAERVDGDDRITNSVEGHQHTLDLDGCEGQTSWSGGEKDRGHSHAWIRSPDGTITIAETLGHTHTLLDEPKPLAPGFVTRGDEQFDRSHAGGERGRMSSPPTPDMAEQIRLLTVRADTADAEVARLRASEQQHRADDAELRADLATARERVATLEAAAAAGVAAAETVAVETQRKRADAAEAEVASLKASIPEVTRKRAALMVRAGAILGPSVRLDSLADRDIAARAIRYLRPKEDIGESVPDEYLIRRLDGLYQDREAHAASLARVGSVTRVDRADDQSPKPQPVAWRDQWQQGAGQYASNHRPRKES